MDKPDWATIAADYIGGEMSMRAAARRHGVPLTTLRNHARREGWDARRLEARHGPSVPADASGGDAAAIFRLTDKLVRRAEELLDGSEEMNARELGELMRALKGAKEIKMLRSALDEREQAARVRALEEKNAERDAALTVEFSPEAEEAAR